MAGIWVFGSDGVVTLQPAAGGGGGEMLVGGAAAANANKNWKKRKVLVWRATGEAIRTLEELEEKLFQMGWHRIFMAAAAENGGGGGGREFRHYHRPANGPYLLTLPASASAAAADDHDTCSASFVSSLHPIHLYNIVVQTRDAFLVLDAAAASSSSS